MKLVLDTPAGLVHATGECDDHKVTAVTLENVPSFVILSDVETDVRGHRPHHLRHRLRRQLLRHPAGREAGVAIRPDQANTLIDSGGASAPRSTSTSATGWSHPENPGIRGVSHVMFTAEPTNPKAHKKNMVMYGPGGLDRSPCGTGTSARMAQMHFRGELALNQDFVHESTIGSLFTGRLIGPAKKVGPFDAVVPTVKGSAYIMGIPQFLLDPKTPSSRASCWGVRGCSGRGD